MEKYEIVKESQGYALVRSTDGRATVVGIDRERNQVTSAMPTDHPTGGGFWVGRLTDGGIDYVSKLYYAGYARRMFRQMSEV